MLVVNVFATHHFTSNAWQLLFEVCKIELKVEHSSEKNIVTKREEFREEHSSDLRLSRLKSLRRTRKRVLGIISTALPVLAVVSEVHERFFAVIVIFLVCNETNPYNKEHVSSILVLQEFKH